MIPSNSNASKNKPCKEEDKVSKAFKAAGQINGKSFGEYFVDDFLMPRAKSVAYNMVDNVGRFLFDRAMTFISELLFDQPAPPSGVTNNNGYKNYSSYSKPGYSSTAVKTTGTEPSKTRIKSPSDYANEVTFANYTEVCAVQARFIEVLNRFGKVSIANYYDFAHAGVAPTLCNNYGWTADMFPDGTVGYRTETGVYRLELPAPKQLL